MDHINFVLTTGDNFLGKAKYFFTLDLALGFWQIPVHADLQEKMAFLTLFSLFEFRVMPFGLKNVPSVFQRLMHQVLSSLNPESGCNFVAAYIVSFQLH